jgi:hypothetical protein
VLRDGAEIVRLTVRAYGKRWLEERESSISTGATTAVASRCTVLPHIGDMLLVEVRTKQLIELFHRIRTVPRTGRDKPAAPRLVYNIYSVVSAMFRDAKLGDLIEQSPCCLDERQLGPLRDTDPEWRAEAVFARGEVETIISTPKIPADRRVVYALELLAGVRPGEASALRWRHYDANVKPLGKLLVALAYNTRKHRAKGHEDRGGQARACSPDARGDPRRVEARRLGRDDGSCPRAG